MVPTVWKIPAKVQIKKSQDWLLNTLAKNRGLTTRAKLQEFLNPTLNQITNAKLTDLEKAVDRVKKAIASKEKIIVYSDYDADGICASALVWETLYDIGADIMPYVPHRIKEGYGLSEQAIKKLAKEGVTLIITVDHGVTAIKQIEEAKKLGVDIIVTDHHLIPKFAPKPYAMVHTTDLCGAGVAWRFCWEVVSKIHPSYRQVLSQKLELAAIATIADLVPLTGANRAIVKLGLEFLSKTQRPGLRSLMRESSLNSSVGTYEIGHIIAPRINAMGRIGHGLDSLRLLCAKRQDQAQELAKLLSKTNTKRQDLTTSAIGDALKMVQDNHLIGVVANNQWHEGVIGLVASRLVETHHRPMIVISRGQQFSKGSARSIPGFNIVDAIRASSEFLVDAGGHPMAAGFTIETKHIETFTKNINVYASQNLTDDLLTPSVNIECTLDSADINFETLKTLKIFEPYGVGNPQPFFLTRNMVIEDVRAVGQNSKHLKLQVAGFEAIGFNMGEKRSSLRPGYLIDLVYTLSENNYNGNKNLQLKIKDFQINRS